MSSTKENVNDGEPMGIPKSLISSNEVLNKVGVTNG
jgi:hypothetical protein